MNQSQFTAIDSRASILKDQDALMVITLSQFTGNDAFFKGGAIYANHCDVNIMWSDFDDNTIFSECGGAVFGSIVIITVTERVFSNNVVEEGDGGAFCTFGGIFIINRSKFRTNEGSIGGVLACFGNTTVHECA